MRGLLSIRRSHSLFILAWIKFFLFGLITFPHSSRHPLTSSGHVISIQPSLPETNVVDLTLIKESQRTPLHKCNLKCLRTILPNRLIKLLTFCRSVLIATESIRKMLAIPTLISSIDQLPITPFKTRGLSNISLSRLKIRHTIDLTKISPPRHIAKSNNVILFHRINVFCCYLLTKSFNRKHFFFLSVGEETTIIPLPFRLSCGPSIDSTSSSKLISPPIFTSIQSSIMRSTPYT